MWVCAHELGHMFMHKRENVVFMDTKTHFNTTVYEREADRFAIELLVSDDLLMEYQNCSISQVARSLGYTEEILNLRLK